MPVAPRLRVGLLSKVAARGILSCDLIAADRVQGCCRRMLSQIAEYEVANRPGRLEPRVRRSPISIAIGGWLFLEENFSGSPKSEACAGAVVE